ncbi:MAG: diguanylate cyclase, partial [Candidatus Omnitrophota bacterium]
MEVTLRSRITVIMIVFVIVLIAAFTAVQLQNQLRVITIFNTLQAKLTAQILEQALESALRETVAENPKPRIDKAIESLRNSGVLETVFVYTPAGKIESSTRTLAIGKTASPPEQLRINNLLKNAGYETRLHSYIDRDSRNLQLYIPISDNSNVQYVARLDIFLGNINEAMAQVYAPVTIIAVIVIVAVVVFGLMLSRRVIGPISLLNTATKEVSAGDLNLRIHMDTHDELEELANTFNMMAVELKKMKEKAENANPLTKLPGNIVIQGAAEERIRNNKKFMVIYGDLDNFKAYNDKYGIYAGDKAIELAAAILKESIAQKGNPDDFVGHEGGDDFILLTTPDKAMDVGNYIIAQFDKRIHILYDKEDLDRGYIVARARHGNAMLKFPLLSISLSGVGNENRPLTSYGEITNIAAELKKKVKQGDGSNFLIDRRKGPRIEEKEKEAA